MASIWIAMKKTSSLPLILGVAVLSATVLQAEQLRWPSWRGAADAGSTAKGSYPAKLDDEHLLWQADLPGRGCSTPIVWDALIILTSAIEGEDGELAFDSKGSRILTPKLLALPAPPWAASMIPGPAPVITI